LWCEEDSNAEQQSALRNSQEVQTIATVRHFSVVLCRKHISIKEIFRFIAGIFIEMIHLLTIGLEPSGSSTVHIYTQTIHRTTQHKQNIRNRTYITIRIHKHNDKNTIVMSWYRPKVTTQRTDRLKAICGNHYVAPDLHLHTVLTLSRDGVVG